MPKRRMPMMTAAFLVAVIIGMRRFGIHNLLYYFPVGLLFWFAVLQSGVHATIAGVILGFLTPTRPVFSSAAFSRKAGAAIRSIDDARARHDNDEAEAVLGELDELTSGTESPADRLVRLLHPWSSFVVLPLFALANAGIALTGPQAASALTARVSLGVIFGLLIGKAIGIGSFSWLAIRSKLASPIAGLAGTQLMAIAILGGIGFTVYLFIADLAFADAALTQQAKVGVLVGSVASAVLGYLLLRFSRPTAMSTEKAAH